MSAASPDGPPPAATGSPDREGARPAGRPRAAAGPPRPAGLPAPLNELDRTAVMGVLNVTPDSFSDGGLWQDPRAAVDHGLRLLDEGADLLDVGGESTRPGAVRVPAEEECRRVLPVIEALVARGAAVSVDTMRAEVARRAVDAGAVVVNDVSGGLADPAMAATAAAADTVLVAMHWRGHSAEMDRLAHYDDVVADVRDELAARLEALVADGVRPDRIVLDPGLGFAKRSADNWPLLAGLDSLAGLGRPLMVGASRKRFLGELLGRERGGPVPPAERDAATAAVSALAAAAGVWCVRVHDVAGSAAAVRVARDWALAGRRTSAEPGALGEATWTGTSTSDQTGPTAHETAGPPAARRRREGETDS